jgi:hypothetical protein
MVFGNKLLSNNTYNQKNLWLYAPTLSPSLNYPSKTQPPYNQEEEPAGKELRGKALLSSKYLYTPYILYCYTVTLYSYFDIFPFQFRYICKFWLPVLASFAIPP